jgi:prepilin signal peptidase PulO-like enzyme (type II secretory pathway)
VGTPLFIVNFFSFSVIEFYSFSAPWWQYAITGIWVAVFCSFLLMIVIDVKHFIIPNGLNLFLGLLGVFYTTLIAIFHESINLFYDSFFHHYGMIFSFTDNSIYSHIGGFFIGGLFFILLVVVTLGKGIGIGDVKLAFALGILLGWPDIAFATMLSFMVGGVISGIFVIFGKKHLKEHLPFAPFFVVGSCLVVFFGFPLLKGYFSIFGL